MRLLLLFIFVFIISIPALLAQDAVTWQQSPAAAATPPAPKLPQNRQSRTASSAVRDSLAASKLLKQDSLRNVARRIDSFRTDSLQLDSISKIPIEPVNFKESTVYKVLEENPYFNFLGEGVYRTIQLRKHTGKEHFFYLLAALFLLLAVVRAGFGRYFNNLFTVFFRASLKQKQIREQLLQTPLASLLLNLLFILAGGLYASFIIGKQPGAAELNFWVLFGYCVAGLAIIYLGKFFILKLLGLTLGMEQTTDTYIFIVFLCNKVLGILLLPLLLLLAFASPSGAIIALTISYVLVGGIFLYRYLSSYGYINREVKASRFHFFLYLCAFELAPLLLIYKGLLKIV